MERICFQVEEAQWFYEDFIRPLDPSLPSLSLRAFSLRIFQHCPLFSEWSADNYTAAFAEFLAYKSRVPVRGAIMLNEDMDQVVLVKGWKKGATWSFPRGKINKDEDDLDCAVREVYEETGFDIRAAGLVREANEMKYIEVTMREQHMRLYVFRAVPMNTHFEPRTRKEISKIEWYKLNDLPTLKKSKQQEGMGEHLANANKFYMVAPFLVPLKKWILQQRKRESHVSSQPYETIPSVAEAAFAGHGADLSNGVHQPANVPSDLPEVSESQAPFMDPSWYSKKPLNTGSPVRIDQEPRSIIPQFDKVKSNALLALLRKGSRPDIPDASKPNTPLDQIYFPPDVPISPRPHHPRPPPFSSLPPPQFPISPLGASEAAMPVVQLAAQAQIPKVFATLAPETGLSAQQSGHQQVAAPYRRTGDPDFSHSCTAPSQDHRVPPASALPPLTNHKRALLDVFKGAALPQQISASPPLSPKQRPLHTAAPPNQGQFSHTTVPAPASVDPSSLLPTLLANRGRAQNQEEKDQKQGSVDHRASLLGLFKKLPAPSAEMAPNSSTMKPALAPVELAASSIPSLPREEAPQKQVLTKLFEPQSLIPTNAVSRLDSGSREGKTSATVSGPLNQPQFDGIARVSRQSSLLNTPNRSPAPSHKTLFDPNQRVQKKILSRPADSEHSPARSSRLVKPSHTASSKRPTSQKGDHAKPFQPQILRRPIADQREPPPQATAQPASEHILAKPKDQPALSTSAALRPLPNQPSVGHHKVQTESQKQTLLSLFGNPISSQRASTPHSIKPALPGNTSTSPAGSGSAIVSPLTEKHVSTRSRLGSLTSIVSTGSQARPVGEKRQTAPGDKEFLLGYLGRIASQG